MVISMTLGKRIRKIIMLIFLALLLIAVSIGIGFYILYGRDILELRDKAVWLARKSSEESFKASQTSLVYAEDGSILSVLKSEKEVYYLPYESIPKAALDAVLVTEDRKFFKHEGIDYLANIRAVLALIKNKGEIRQGASTITQQLARNVFLTNEVTYDRKVTELFLAAELEKKYSKKQILEFYFNNIYYANGYYGIQAASNGYFSKGASELSLSEIAFLSAIPNSPTMLNPLTNFKDTMERRDKILLQMYEANAITLSEYEKASKEKIVLNHSTNTNHNYAESFTYYSAIRMLMEAEGFEFKLSFVSEEEKRLYEESYYEAYYRIQRQLYTKGYRIYTSIDLQKQEQLQKAVDENLSKFTKVNEEGIYELQGAAVSIDNDTGHVVAIIGGRYQETSGYTLNRAYQSFRQPGSAIKPLLIYTPMFERGYYKDTLVMDVKAKDGPRNATNVYSGEITLEKAVEVSKNTVAWNLLKELSPSVGLSYLLEMNFSHIVDEDYNLGISLGGFTYGVSPVEMTAGFASIANDGVYRTPTCVVKITDADGNEIVGESVKEKRIYDINASRIMTNVLTNVMKNGTGRKLALDHITTAGKTGTTTDRKDGWFVGYSKYYTTGVWVGCDYPKTIDDLGGSTYPGYIWKDYMNEIHKGLADAKFEEFIDDRPGEIKEEPGVTSPPEEVINDTTEGVTDEVTEESTQEGTDEVIDSPEDALKDPTVEDQGTSEEEWEEDATNAGESNDALDEEPMEEIDADVEESLEEDLEEEIWDEEQWQNEQWGE